MDANKIFFGNNETTLHEFKDTLSKIFEVEFLGQAHWYLSARIYQDADFSLTLDQARCYKAIVNRFLEKAGAKKPRFHSTILPAEFVPSVENCCEMHRQPKFCRKNIELVMFLVLEPCYTCLTLYQIRET